MMERQAFLMKIKKGFEAEYKRRHDEIWPELKEQIAAAGIRDYSIYLDERTQVLFACLKLENGHTSENLPSNPVVRKWWNYMADIMEVNPDNSPVQLPIREVFHMD